MRSKGLLPLFPRLQGQGSGFPLPQDPNLSQGISVPSPIRPCHSATPKSRQCHFSVSQDISRQSQGQYLGPSTHPHWGQCSPTPQHPTLSTQRPRELDPDVACAPCSLQKQLPTLAPSQLLSNFFSSTGKSPSVPPGLPEPLPSLWQTDPGRILPTRQSCLLTAPALPSRGRPGVSVLKGDGRRGQSSTWPGWGGGVG